MLSRRQINVQRDNLFSMCRISVKALLDLACLHTQVDDDCEEFINFCAVFEQLVSHRLKPTQQKKVWRLPGIESPRHFWDVLLDTQARSQRHDATLYFKSCVPSIDSIENFKSPMAKLRAFIRVALMEKRLSDYLMWVLDHQDMLKLHYFDGALILSEEASVLCGDLIGLNAIDFNFCLKDNKNEFLGPLEISYAKFLRYKQSPASRSRDEIEMHKLNQPVEEEDEDEEEEEEGEGRSEANVKDLFRLRELERDFKAIKEQKDYLEELARLRERQVVEGNTRLEALRLEFASQQKEWDRERHTMDSCILELQADLTKLYQQNERQRFQLAFYKQFKDRLAQQDVPMEDMAHTGQKHAEGPVSPHQGIPQTSLAGSRGHKRESSQHSTDRRSLQSFLSDTHSMVPLTGSLADVNIAMLDAGSKVVVTKHMSQFETDDQVSTSAGEDVIFQCTTTEASVAQSGAEDGVIVAGSGQSLPIMMESFVMTEERGEIERAVKQALATHGGMAGEIVDVTVAGVASVGEVDGSSLTVASVTKGVMLGGSGDDIVGGVDEMDVAVGGVSEKGLTDCAASFSEGDVSDVTVTELREEKEDNKDSDDGGCDSGSVVVKDSEEEDEEEEEEEEEKEVIPDTGAISYKKQGEENIGAADDVTPVQTEKTQVSEAEPTIGAEQTNESKLGESTVAEDEPKTQDLNNSAVVLSDPEDYVVTSDPEMLDPNNTSSDGSDAAWDMMSDSENAVDAAKEESLEK